MFQLGIYINDKCFFIVIANDKPSNKLSNIWQLKKQIIYFYTYFVWSPLLTFTELNFRLLDNVIFSYIWTTSYLFRYSVYMFKYCSFDTKFSHTISIGEKAGQLIIVILFLFLTIFELIQFYELENCHLVTLYSKKF